MFKTNKKIFNIRYFVIILSGLLSILCYQMSFWYFVVECFDVFGYLYDEQIVSSGSGVPSGDPVILVSQQKHFGLVPLYDGHCPPMVSWLLWGCLAEACVPGQQQQYDQPTGLLYQCYCNRPPSPRDLSRPLPNLSCPLHPESINACLNKIGFWGPLSSL